MTVVACIGCGEPYRVGDGGDCVHCASCAAVVAREVRTRQLNERPPSFSSVDAGLKASRF